MGLGRCLCLTSFAREWCWGWLVLNLSLGSPDVFPPLLSTTTHLLLPRNHTSKCLLSIHQPPPTLNIPSIPKACLVTSRMCAVTVHFISTDPLHSHHLLSGPGWSICFLSLPFQSRCPIAVRVILSSLQLQH